MKYLKSAVQGISIQKTSTGNFFLVNYVFHCVNIFALISSSHLLKWKPRLLMGGKGANPDISDSFFRTALGELIALSCFDELPKTTTSITPDSEMKFAYVTFFSVTWS